MIAFFVLLLEFSILLNGNFFLGVSKFILIVLVAMDNHQSFYGFSALYRGSI